jgi:hypothetical protein
MDNAIETSRPAARVGSLSAQDITTLCTLAQIAEHGPSSEERKLAHRLIRAIARRADTTPIDALIAACAALPIDDEEEGLMLAAA